MRIQLATRDLRRLVSASPGTASHCRRVAALSREVAGRLPLSWRAVTTLEQAALLHHTPPVLLYGGSVNRLITDLAPEAAPAKRTDGAVELPEELAAVLSAFHGNGPAGGGDERHTGNTGLMRVS